MSLEQPSTTILKQKLGYSEMNKENEARSEKQNKMDIEHVLCRLETLVSDCKNIQRAGMNLKVSVEVVGGR